MKTILTLTLSALVVTMLAADKPAEKTIPPPNNLTLQAATNVASSSGCPVTALARFNTSPVKNATVSFYWVPRNASDPPFATRLTNSAGKTTPPVIVAAGRTIEAGVPGYHGVEVTSNQFSCPGENQPD